MIKTSSDPNDPAYPNEDIAIVGMSCVFPGADTPAQFWHNLVHGVDCITDATPDWQPELFYDPVGGPSVDKSYVQRGGFLGDLCRFNPARYGVMPTSVEGSEPDHFIALRCAYEAVADAGAPEIPFNRDRTGVIVGRGTFVNRGWVSVFLRHFAIDQVLSVLRMIDPQRSEEELDFLRVALKKNLPPANADTFPGLVHSALVGRIANRMDLHGPAYTLDAACASVGLCLEHGIRELRSGRCDAVLVGGSQVSLPAQVHIMFCHIEALSRAGEIAPFSAQAAGTVLGQGCGMVVIKRRSDAERDGNRIYALVKAVGSSSDGKGAGLLAPLSEGQQLAIRRAYEQSGLDMSSIGLIEAHGTGIALGDATEVNTLTECFGGPESCGPTVALGSVKSMIGHLIPASGAASLIKAALAVYHRVLPPTLHAQESHPDLHLDATRFYVCSQATPWLHGERATPRRAGINAFGFGGINSHVIVEEHPREVAEQPRLEREWPAELIVVSAADPQSLKQEVAALATWVEGAEGVSLLDIAASAATRTGPSRLAVVAQDKHDLVRKLTRSAELLDDPERERIQDRKGVFWYARPLAREGRTAFVFPGEGSQYITMHADLCRNFPEVRRQFDLTDIALQRREGRAPLGMMLYPQPGREREAEDAMLRMETAVASVTAAGRGLLDLLASLGVAADTVVGHSSGEFAAILASGAYAPHDDDELIESIIAGMDSTARIAGSTVVSGAVLTAVGGADPGAVEAAVERSGERLVLAMDNCPHQQVVVGDEESTAQALEYLQSKGGICQRIPWDRPYHTDAFAPLCEDVDAYIRTLTFKAPDVEMWSCATAQPFPADPASIKDLTVRQWRSRVRFRETILAMHDAGVRVFIEVGPRSNLSAFIADTLADQPHAAIPMDVQRKNGLEQLCRAVGMMVAHGVDLKLDRLYRRREPQILDLDQAPPPAPKPDPILRLELPELELSEDDLAEVRRRFAAPDHALPPPEAPTPSVASDLAASSAASDPRTAAFADYQHTMQMFLKVQQDTLCRPAVASPVAARQAPPCREPARSREPSYPYLHTLVEHVAGHRLVAECEISPETDTFLLDHTLLGRSLSARDPSFHSLPVMPLAMSLELLAEAAARLLPDLVVTAVADIRVSGWLAFESPSRRLRVTADLDQPGRVRARLTEADREDTTRPIVEAVVELSANDRSLGPAVLGDVSGQPPPWAPEDVYGMILYHGPAFQGVDLVERWSPNGIRARVRQPDPGLMHLDQKPHAFQLPVQLTDTASQIPAMMYTNWDLKGPTCTCAFPHSIERLEFDPSLSGHPSLVAVAHYAKDGTELKSDVELRTPDGRAVLRYLGRVEKEVDFPLALYRYAFDPLTHRCARDISGMFCTAPELDGVSVYLVQGPEYTLFLHPFWRTVLAHMVLDRAEQMEFAKVPGANGAKADWLLGRIAAKEAVRHHAGLHEFLADIRLAIGPGGEPAVATPTAPAVRISLAQRAGTGVAIAVPAGGCSGVGIDLEPVAPMGDAEVKALFTDEELIRIRHWASAGGMSLDVCHRICRTAIAAVSKALGREAAVAPQTFQLTAMDSATVRVAITLRDTNNQTDSNDRPLVAISHVVDGVVISGCVLPSWRRSHGSGSAHMN